MDTLSDEQIGEFLLIYLHFNNQKYHFGQIPLRCLSLDMPWKLNKSIQLMSQLSRSLLHLVILLVSVSSTQDYCRGYQPDVSAFAVNYAFCSNLLTPYANDITNWSFEPCLNAQSKTNVADIEVITDQEKDLLVFLAHDKVRNLNVVSFRATMICNKKNALQDFDAIPADYQQWGCSGRRGSKCRIHRGFVQNYQALRDKVREKALQLVNNYPSADFLVTGVSLGGAIAAIASYDLKMYLTNQRKSVNLLSYTYGQPRIGNEELVKQFNSHTRIYRIVNRQDPVPHLPPRQIGFLMFFVYFYHPGIEVYYFNDQQDPQVCEGDNPSCSYNHNKEKDYDVCHHITYTDVNYRHKNCSLETKELSLQYTQKDSKADYKNALSFINGLPKLLKKENRKKCSDKPQTRQLVCQGDNIEVDENFVGLQTFGDMNKQEKREAIENVEYELKVLQLEAKEEYEKEKKNQEL